MKILAVNPGSSSLKFGFYEFTERSTRTIIEDETERVAATAMGAAVDQALARVEASSVDAIGCRIVHGGEKFWSPTLIDDAVLDEIAQLADLAPLHNPIAVTTIKELRAALPKIPVVAVFDTAFHHSLPELAWRYAVPESVNIRRYGFHGISYAYVSARLTTHIGADKRVVICHLGNGASVCAVANGVSVDTSMGLTPMEGLVMGTRSGDIDPGAILYLLRSGKTADEIDHILNHESGLAGLSGGTGDMRQIEKAEMEGDDRANLAIELFAYRAAKYIGAYAAAMGGIDCLAFTAGIGEHSATIRDCICARLAFLGIEIDERLNEAKASDERNIGRGRVPVYVIPTNEELQLARETYALLSSRA